MSYTTEIVGDIALCAKAICQGEIVAFGTETVYGLGADCTNERAVAKIFEAKGRPSDNPLIVHVSGIDQARDVAGEWTEEMDSLAHAFFPGPFTMVVKKGKSIPEIVSAGLDTVGIRMPCNYMAVEFIRACGTPIAAPSANISGRPSPTRAEHVYRDMKGKIPYILDCGECLKGIESTVYDVARKTVLRPGIVTPEDISRIVGRVAVSLGERGTFRSPGMKYAHYHPSYKVVLVRGENIPKKIEELCKSAAKAGEKYAILDLKGDLKYISEERVSFDGDLEAAAAGLYSVLLDYEGRTDMLIIAGVEPKGIGLALMNRLEKAAAGNIID